MRWFVIGSLAFFAVTTVCVLLLMAVIAWKKNRQLRRIPPGEFIVFRDDVGYAVIDPATGTKRTWTPVSVESAPPDRFVLGDSAASRSERFSIDYDASFDASMSPSGGHLAVVDPRPLGFELSVIDVNSRKRTVIDYGSPAVDWSGDGKLLAAICRPGPDEAHQVVIFDASKESATVVAELDAHCTSVDWSSDDKKLLVAGWGGIRIIDLSRDKAVVSDGPRGVLDSAVWSPDGSQIAWRQRVDRGPWTIMVSRADGSDRKQMFEVAKLPRSLIRNRAYIGAKGRPCWSPDGKYIAFFAAMEGDCRVQGSGDLLGKYGLFVVDVAMQRCTRLTASRLPSAPSVAWLRSDARQKD